MELPMQPEVYVGLLTLTAMKIVLGIDNPITAVGMAERVPLMVVAMVVQEQSAVTLTTEPAREAI